MDKAKLFDSIERPGISPDELALLNAVLAENGSTEEARRAINHNFHQSIAPAALREKVRLELVKSADSPAPPPAPKAAVTTPKPKKNEEPDYEERSKAQSGPATTKSEAKTTAAFKAATEPQAGSKQRRKPGMAKKRKGKGCK